MDNPEEDDRMEREEPTEDQPQSAPLPLIDYGAPPEVWVPDICRRLQERTTRPGELLSRILYAYRNNIQALSNRLHVPVPKLQEFIDKWNERMGPRLYTSYLQSLAEPQSSTSTSGQQPTTSSEQQASTSTPQPTTSTSGKRPTSSREQQPSASSPNQEQPTVVDELQVDSKQDSDVEEIDGDEDSEGESVASSVASTGSSLDGDDAFNEDDFVDVDDYEDDDEEDGGGSVTDQPVTSRAVGVRDNEFYTENGIPIRSCLVFKRQPQIKKGTKNYMIREAAIELIKKDLIKRGIDPGPDFELMDKHKKDLIRIIDTRIIPIGKTHTMEIVKGIGKGDQARTVRIRKNGETYSKISRGKNKGKLRKRKKAPFKLCKYNNCWKPANKLDYCLYHASFNNLKVIVATHRDVKNTDEDVIVISSSKLVEGENDAELNAVKRTIYRVMSKEPYKVYTASRPLTKEGIPNLDFQPDCFKLCLTPKEASEEKSRWQLAATLKKLTANHFGNSKQISILTSMCGIPKTEKQKALQAIRKEGIELTVEKLPDDHVYNLPSYLKAAKNTKYSGQDNQLYSRRGKKAIYVGKSEQAVMAGRKNRKRERQTYETYEDMTGDKLQATIDFILKDPTEILKAESLYILAAVLGYLNKLPYADSNRILEIINLEFKQSLLTAEDLDNLNLIFEYLFHHRLIFKQIPTAV